MEAIGLNPIRLDAIGIDPIRLNAIRLGVPGASSGSGSPYIAPEVLASLVAVVKCDGKSNNDPDRAIIKNLVDPDNPFVISNAAYKLNSGFGKYEEDFSTWKSKSNSGIKISSDGTKIETLANNFSCQYDYSSIGRDTPSFKVKISNFTEGAINYYYREEDGNEKHINFGPITVANSKGIIELPKSYNTVENGIGFRGGFVGILGVNIGVTIEQIPSFQGSFYADGVNDMITSTKTMSEMLGGGNKCTVISFITHISGAGKYNVIGNNRIQVSDYSGQSFMAGCSSKSGEKIVELGDKEKIQAFQYNTFDSKLSIGSLESGLEISSYAYYGTFVFNKDSVPIDWIHQVIAYFYLDKYVTPGIIYDTIRQGITNENHVSFNDELVDFSGNGHNLKIYNSAWNKESGINDEGAWQTDAVEDYGQFVGDLGLKDYTIAVDRAYPSLKGNGVPVISSIKNDTATPFLFEFADNTSVVRPYSFGATTVLSPMELSRKISYQSTYIYDGTAINKGLHDNTGNGLTIGRFGIDTQYANIALWSLLLFPYTLSEFLLERQLKRYKLGTLYPDMVEFRPVIKSNSEYSRVEIFYRSVEYPNVGSITAIVGNYYPTDGTLLIKVFPNNIDEVSNILVNGKLYPITYNASDKSYQSLIPIAELKSPQKIDITIDEYIRYEDIVQPYPFIIPIIDTDGKEYTYGDKIKVGTEIRGGINGNNLLPELYKLNGYFNFNGAYFSASNKHVIGKTNVFELTNAPTYLKANEPNCIADPQRLRIPNSSYKILGYIPDISGHGNHLKINNSAYAGMSGANGYVEDFTTWSRATTLVRTDSKIIINSVSDFNPANFILWKTNLASNAFKVKIKGLPKNYKLIYLYKAEGDTSSSNIEIKEDGIYSLPASIVLDTGHGFRVDVQDKSELVNYIGLTIEQIGEYEGSFCLDGVDDFITIPTLEGHGGKQVLMKVNYRLNSSRTCTLYDQRTILSGWQETFTIVSTSYNIAYALANNGQTYIDGILNTNIIGNSLANITHNISVVNENVSESNTGVINIGAQAEYKGFGNMSLFAFMSFPEISTEEEIKELNDIVGIEGGYVESPDYYWDAYGKSNMAALDIDYQDLFQSGNASKMLIDKSKAGLAALELYHNSGDNSELINRRLNLNNFAFNEESGYSGWLGVTDLTNYLNYNNSTINNWKRGGTFIKGKNRNFYPYCGNALAIFIDDTNHILKFKIKITGLTDTDELYICQYLVDSVAEQQLFNGINEVTLDISTSTNPTYRYISFRYPPLTNDVDFEFLYEYQNGLLSDGVDDELKNEHMPVLTDYTWIMKRKRLNDKGSTTLCHKGNGSNSNAFLFEIIEGTTKTRSFGTDSTVVFPDLISWQTKNSYNGQTIASGTGVDGNVLHIFMGSNVYPYYTKAVFYKAMLYSKTIDQLSINMLKNLFEKDELIDVNNPIFKQNN